MGRARRLPGGAGDADRARGRGGDRARGRRSARCATGCGPRSRRRAGAASPASRRSPRTGPGSTSGHRTRRRPPRRSRARRARLADKALLELLLDDALAANAATGDPCPVQVHCGFGDADLRLDRADPALLGPLIERYRDTPFVLLHCYPFIRQAGWLAHVHANVFLDVSLTIPHVWRASEAIREALELAPVSKLLYASDAARTPELYYLAAKAWRGGAGRGAAEALQPDEAERAGRRVLRDNALALYRL